MVFCPYNDLSSDSNSFRFGDRVFVAERFLICISPEVCGGCMPVFAENDHPNCKPGLDKVIATSLARHVAVPQRTAFNKRHERIELRSTDISRVAHHRPPKPESATSARAFMLPQSCVTTCPLLQVRLGTSFSAKT